jgi:hypothetical protein
VYREKECLNCGIPYTPRYPNERYCNPCRVDRKKFTPPRHRVANDPWICKQESFICRRCDAQPGYQCVTASGAASQIPHIERYQDAGGSEAAPKAAATDERRRASGRKRHAAKRARNRRRVLEHYGTSCACCDTMNDLTIDHINGDGKQHRNEIGDAGGTLSAWLINNHFPPGFQILCRACNKSKRDGKHCRIFHGPTLSLEEVPTVHSGPIIITGRYLVVSSDLALDEVSKRLSDAGIFLRTTSGRGAAVEYCTIDTGQSA